MIQLNHTYSGIPFETAIAGEPAAADPLPTAVLYRNGSASGVTVTVATTAVVGLYHCSFTTDAGWAKTDRLYLQVSATLGSITDRRVIWDSFAEPDAVMRGTDNALLATSYTAPANTDIAAILEDTSTTLPDQIAGISGGARTVTVTVDDGSTVLQNATVRMTEGVNTYTALTNVSGVAVFNLDDATYTVGISKSGYSFAGASLVVDGTEVVTYSMTQVSVPAPEDPALCAVTIPIVNQHGVALVGETVEIRFNAFDADATTTTLVLSPPPTQVSDENGRVIVNLLRLASYSVFYGQAPYQRRVDIDVPDAGTFVVGE